MWKRDLTRLFEYGKFDNVIHCKMHIEVSLNVFQGRS
jgi:hypothetical protein